MTPEPLILLTIEPAFAARGRLADTLQVIGLQTHIDVQVDQETGRIVLGGRSEDLLGEALVLLRARVPDEYSVGAPRVVYREAGTKLLQPIMSVEVVTPEDYLGDVIGDINSRRGQIQGTDTRGNAQAVKALVPLAAMFGFTDGLREYSQGRAEYTMQLSHYEEMPDGEGPPDTEPPAAALRA